MALHKLYCVKINFGIDTSLEDRKAKEIIEGRINEALSKLEQDEGIQYISTCSIQIDDVE